MTDDLNSAIRSEVAVTNQLSRWLATAGVQTTELAVDIVDIIGAAKQMQREVEALLRLDPRQPEDADTALAILGRLHAWAFTEIKHHVHELEKAWPELEDRIAELGTDSE